MLCTTSSCGRSGSREARGAARRASARRDAGGCRGVRAPARRSARPLRSLDRRFPARAARHDGREGGRRRAPPQRKLPPARRVRPAAVPRADARRPRGALDPRPRRRAVPRARRRGAAAEPARADPARGGSAAALLLDRLAADARHDGPQHAEEPPRLRRHRSRGARLAADQRERGRRALHLGGGDRPRAGTPPDPGRPAPPDEAAGAPAGRPGGRRRPPPALDGGWEPVRPGRARARARLAVDRGSLSALRGPRAQAPPGPDRPRGPPRRRDGVVPARGARQRRAVVRPRARRLAHRPVSR